jgi:hypothetical protein
MNQHMTEKIAMGSGDYMGANLLTSNTSSAPHFRG